MKEIQRYNQGFYGFGPLEKCNTGKLVKFEDADKKAHEYQLWISDLRAEFLKERAEILNKNNEQEREINNKSVEINSLNREKYHLNVKLIDSRTLLFCSVITNIVFFAVFVMHYQHG